jgi:hypothetical protein
MVVLKKDKIKAEKKLKKIQDDLDKKIDGVPGIIKKAVEAGFKTVGELKEEAVLSPIENKCSRLLEIRETLNRLKEEKEKIEDDLYFDMSEAGLELCKYGGFIFRAKKQEREIIAVKKDVPATVKMSDMPNINQLSLLAPVDAPSPFTKDETDFKPVGDEFITPENDDQIPDDDIIPEE